MALIYFDPYPKIPIIQGRLSILKMYLSLIFLGRVLTTGWISKEGLIAQIYQTFFWKLSTPSTLENLTPPDLNILFPTTLSWGGGGAVHPPTNS